MTATKAELEILARAYREGMDSLGTPEARAAVDAEVRRIEATFAELTKKVAVKFVAKDPYRSFEEMRDRVRGERQMLVWTGESDTPLWEPVVNWKARAIHDWDHIQHGLDFSMEGEAGAFRVAAARMPGLAPLYLSEIALQAAVYNFYQTFDAQKLVVPTQDRVERIVRQLRGLRGIPNRQQPLYTVWFVYGLYERGLTDGEVMLHMAAANIPAHLAVPIVAAGRELHEGRKSPRR